MRSLGLVTCQQIGMSFERCQFVHVNDESTIRAHGVPQGSVLGHIIFTLQMLPLGNICRNPLINFDVMLDDTQISLLIKPSGHKQWDYQKCFMLNTD